jgi:hypothetical protein
MDIQRGAISKNNLTLLIIILIILALPLTLFLLSRSTDRQSQAASLSQETESGVITAPATKLDDPTASGGQYVRFGP